LRIEAGEERLGEARNGVEAGAVLELKVLEGEAQIPMRAMRWDRWKTPSPT